MANAILIFIIIALICVAVRRIYKTVRYGSSCCGGSEGMEKKISVKDRNKGNYPFSYRLKVDGMVCAGCVRKVENAINSEGELWAKADLGSKEVEVLSKRVMSRDDFLQLLRGTSYTLVEVN